MGQNLSPCTPTTLHIDQGRPGDVVSDVTRNILGRDMGFGHFFLNGRHENVIWAISSLKLT